MNLKSVGSILAKVGTSLIRDIVPGAGAVIDLVNGFLPDDKKLDIGTATGQKAISAINQLPPDKQVELLSKELDVEIAEIQGWTNVVGMLAEADKSGSTTRPKIAVMMAWCVFISSMIFTLTMSIAVIMEKVDLVKAIADAWPLVLASLGTPTALLRAYFGIRSDEKKSRYKMAQGLQSGQIFPSEDKGVLTKIVKSIF